MKKSIMLLSVLGVLASAPAMADDGLWPRNPAMNPTLGDTTGYATASQTEAVRAHNAALRARIIAEGGCNANDLPYWVAQGCDGAPFVKATDGGGDGSSGGDSSGSGTSGSDAK
jgi:hypothetical protein